MICQIVKFFWARSGLAGPHNLLPAAPLMPGGVRGGVRPSRPLRPKFRQGFPPGFQNPNFFLARSMSCGDPSCVPAPPPVLLSVCGGVRPRQSRRPKFRQGFPPWGENFQIFHLARCLNYPARLRPTKGGTYMRVRIVRGRRWLGTSAGSITPGSCTTGGIPARPPEAAWQGDIL